MYNIVDFVYFVVTFDSLQTILSYVNGGIIFLHGYSELHSVPHNTQ